MARIGLIWAQAHGGIIGATGGMPWHVPEDLAHFKELTLGAPVVMGRRTWDSFPDRFRPLPGRRNIVITRNDAWAAEGAERAASLDDGLALAASDDPDWIWVIGGGEVFREAMPRAHRLEVTELDLAVSGDTTAPPVDGWRAVASDPDAGAHADPDAAIGWHTSRSGVRYRFVRYER
ncbi:dihydrofolate reductase [Microbacterium elymi]|uniref:Dihydrofolate reductase n=1 Tax=Microbacterium elymi TaxID=2909587 RepID=A0ABY5NIT6_9MICO|nr:MULTISPECIES: dihydrofolate reductase [Microbacterium]UUT35092.1 dihydrofolate reductase [Microbacterium elymi]